MKKSLLLLIVLFGCSTPVVHVPYHGGGDSQINVSFDGNWSMGRKTILLGIHELVKKCDYKFLGEIKINDESDRLIMIPSGKKVILRTVFIKGHKERTQDFLFIPKKHQVYNVSIYERDGFLGNRVYQMNKQSKIEVDTLEEKCAHR
jgi:hypothetical protein